MSDQYGPHPHQPHRGDATPADAARNDAGPARSATGPTQGDADPWAAMGGPDTQSPWARPHRAVSNAQAPNSPTPNGPVPDNRVPNGRALNSPTPNGPAPDTPAPDSPVPTAPFFIPGDYPPPAPGQQPWGGYPVQQGQASFGGGWTPPLPGPGQSSWGGGWGPAPQPPRRRRGPLLLVIGLALVVFTGALFGSIGVMLRPTMPGLAPPASGAASWGNYTPFMPNASPNNPGATVRPTAPSAEQTDASGDQIRGVAIVEAMLSVTEGSAGTGMVIGDSGIVLTNYHVVQGTNGTINVTIASTGSTYSAKVLGHDKANDVALLSLNGASGLPTVKIDADGVRAGDQVTSVGNTDGRRKIMAAPGEVLSTNESILTRDEGSTATNQLSGVYETSSRAMHGDSGGPTYDSQTEVIGLTTAGSADDGSQFATAYVVPIARALDIANKISRNEPSGTVQMGP